MANRKTKAKTAKQLPAEIGFRVPERSIYDFNYHFFDEERDLTFPYSVVTYDRMSKDTILAAAISAVKTIALRVPRYIEPYNEKPMHKNRAEFVEECLGIGKDVNDMTHSFDDFLSDCLSYGEYGFSFHEKVFRLRRYKYGSKYDDGKVGIKRLPLRPQKSIEGFEYDDEGRELTHVLQKQSARRISKINKTGKLTDIGAAKIPIQNLLHFCISGSDGRAEGVSPLAAVHSTYTDYLRFKDLEGIAASKNLNGLPVVWMPSEYMNADTSDPMHETYKTLVDGVSKIAIGSQSSLALPSDREDMTGQGGKLFDFTLMSASSSNITAITSIIERLKKEMLLCLFASEISEAMDGTKTSMLTMLVESRIKKIFNVLNNDLIPHLFRLNGWDDTQTPKIRYGKLREIPFESFAKGLQQTKATKLIPVTADNINYISEQLGLPHRVELDISQDDLEKRLGVEQADDSGAGAGYTSESGVGTSKGQPESDASSDNLYNK